MPSEMTDREWRQFLLEKIESIDSRQAATARATRFIADGLTAASQRHENDNRRWEEIYGAALAALAAKQDTDLKFITAHDLANSVKPEVVNLARKIQWARHNGEPEPLPETPDELVPVHHHRRKDDSITFEVDKTGATRLKSNIKLKTLAGWTIAGILGAIHVYQLIANALHAK